MTGNSPTLTLLLAPIADALADPLTTEIVVQKPGVVGIERDGVWSFRDVPEFTFECLDAISILAGNLLSKDFDHAHPIVETTLPGGFRYTALRPPVTLDGTISIAIRKPRAEVAEAEDLDYAAFMEGALHYAQQTHPADDELLRLYQAKEWSRFFPLAIEARKSIAATGPTFTGKTTFLRKMMKKIPPHQRLVTIEDTEEFLAMPPALERNRVSLIFGSAGVTAEKLILTSLRLRADRVAIQELRGAEAWSYLRIHQAGTTGGFTSWHADHGDPFSPVALMIKGTDAGRNIPMEELITMVRSIIDIVAHCRRDPVTDRILPPSIYFRLADNAH